MIERAGSLRGRMGVWNVFCFQCLWNWHQLSVRGEPVEPQQQDLVSMVLTGSIRVLHPCAGAWVFESFLFPMFVELASAVRSW
jgi:hypothetical protein